MSDEAAARCCSERRRQAGCVSLPEACPLESARVRLVRADEVTRRCSAPAGFFWPFSGAAEVATPPRLNMIKLIVGLGNPGAEYTATRHNAGFWFVDQLARDAGASLRDERRFHGHYGRGRLNGQEIHLLEPQTFMNRSGQSVVAVAQFFKILPDEILVAHDELDLPPGTVKLKLGGGSGGHNGLKDISAHLSIAAVLALADWHRASA